VKLSHDVSITRTRPIFPVFAFKVMHRVILLTRFYKLLTTVAILSGGHVPQVPQWHDAPVQPCPHVHFNISVLRQVDSEILELVYLLNFLSVEGDSHLYLVKYKI